MRFLERRKRFGPGCRRGDPDVVAADQFHDAVALGRIVLHHQQVLHFAREKVFHPGEGLIQRFLVGRFGDIGQGTQLAATLGFLLYRNDVHRDVTGCRVVFQLIENDPAARVRQPHIQGDGIRPVLPGQHQRGLSLHRHQGLEAALMGKVQQDAGEARVVFDDQDHAIARLNIGAVILDPFHHECGGHPVRGSVIRPWHAVRGVAALLHAACVGESGRDMSTFESPLLFIHRSAFLSAWPGPRRTGPRFCRRGIMQRQIQRECAALSGHALQANFAAQQTRQFAADCQPQPRAAVFAAGGAIGLLECLEDDLLLVFGDADASIADGKRHHRRGLAQGGVVATPALRRWPDFQSHFAFSRELERIGQQVLGDLLQAPFIGKYRGREGIIELDGKFQFLVVGDVAEGLLDEVAQLRKRHLADIRGHRPGFNLGQVQDIVDEVQQIVA